MAGNVELHISQRSPQAASAIIGANVLVTSLLLALVASAGDHVPSTDASDVIFEGAGAVVAFMIFVAAALVTTRAIPMPLLLAGLFVFQIGRALDLADELVIFDFAFWSVTGDAFTLAGEITLTIVAFYFVRLSSIVVNTDALTGLHNRAYHVRELAGLLSKHGGDRPPVAVIAFDLDNFKHINDAHGHAYGDEVLVHTAALLKRNSRRGEIVSRTGGEEFEVILPKADRQHAVDVAERIRQALASSPPARLEKLTASIGVALSGDGDTVETLRKRADDAAYEAKQAGRNKVVVAD